MRWLLRKLGLRCPTCGGAGPDVWDPAGDYGAGWELRCGDDWHERRGSPGYAVGLAEYAADLEKLQRDYAEVRRNWERYIGEASNEDIDRMGDA